MLLRGIRRNIFSTSITTQLTRKVAYPSPLMRMASTLPRLPLFDAIAGHDPQSTAIIHCTSGRTFTYGSLLQDVADAKERLREAAGSQAVEGQTVAFLVENGYDYVGATWFARDAAKVADRRQ